MTRAARHNLRSWPVPEHLGFTFGGYQREAALLQKASYDLAIYSMLAQEWSSETNIRPESIAAQNCCATILFI